jgi:hypothetical protein
MDMEKEWKEMLIKIKKESCGTLKIRVKNLH